MAHPQQGFRVTPLSVSDLIDLTAARCDIEGVTLRHAVLHGDLRWESELVAATHTLERTGALMVADHDGDQRVRPLDRVVHDSDRIPRRPPGRMPEPATSSLCVDDARCGRALSGVDASLDRETDPTVEHRVIVDAALVRDADLAVELLRQHVQGMTDLMIASRTTPDSDLTTTAAT